MIPTVINHGKGGIWADNNQCMNWACGSCGCRLEEVDSKTNFNESEEGITIWAGKHSEPFETEEFTLAHVETSAGTLTIGLRHEPFYKSGEFCTAF